MKVIVSGMAHDGRAIAKMEDKVIFFSEEKKLVEKPKKKSINLPWLEFLCIGINFP